ncbi:hypothetical protein [Pedobacter caeni]|uniref:Uncharacterized protein n=1 Tax=Pedobacter caeni TaxID=288992 RepID=A0A1M4TR91_9SPHI|nr:hypothetical protein [Pedobacter caeni]SHE47029.1 hypothetical protein SAMN04488522_101290 [Pedobacter caeni]
MRSFTEIYKSYQDYSGSVERRKRCKPQYLSREATYIVVLHQSFVK